MCKCCMSPFIINCMHKLCNSVPFSARVVVKRVSVKGDGERVGAVRVGER